MWANRVQAGGNLRPMVQFRPPPLGGMALAPGLTWQPGPGVTELQPTRSETSLPEQS